MEYHQKFLKFIYKHMNVHLILQWGRFHYWQHASHMARNLLLNTWTIMWTCLHSSFETNQFLAFCLRNQWILKIAYIVGGFNPSEKKHWSNWIISQGTIGGTIKMFEKPPPSWIWMLAINFFYPFLFHSISLSTSRGALISFSACTCFSSGPATWRVQRLSIKVPHVRCL